LAEAKLSHRKIAAATGVSRGTIGAIASGRRREPVKRTLPWDEALEIPAGPPERCPDCGGMVYLPCRLCRTRKEIARKPSLRNTFPAGALQRVPLLGLNLKPAHQLRYEEVRQQRKRQEIMNVEC
jgi:transcriptional regulator with XRE-family HTH domain